MYRSDGNEKVSKEVKKAYDHYENIEFMSKPNDPRRQIKLIDLSREDGFSNVCKYLSRDCLTHIVLNWVLKKFLVAIKREITRFNNVQYLPPFFIN